MMCCPVVNIILKILRQHTLGTQQLVDRGLYRALLRVVFLEEAVEHVEITAVEHPAETVFEYTPELHLAKAVH
jgi:hypothetical protein